MLILGGAGRDSRHRTPGVLTNSGNYKNTRTWSVPGYSIPCHEDGMSLTPLELQEGCIIYTHARAPPQTPSSGTYAQLHEDFTPTSTKWGHEFNAFPRAEKRERERELAREIERARERLRERKIEKEKLREHVYESST